MRIAQVCPWFYPHLGGVESHVLTLSQELTARGHQVTVVTSLDNPREPERERMGKFDVLRVKPRLVAMRTPVTPRIRAALRDVDADIVHAHLPPPLTAHYAADAAERRGIPFVVTYHCDVELPSPLGNLLEAIYRRSLGSSTLRRAARVVVTTRTYAATSRTVWRHNPTVIPNAVDARRFHPDPTAAAAVRERLGLSAKKPIVLLVCRIVPHKGVEHFIEAARSVPDAHFVVGGEGSSLPAMKHLAVDLDVADRVRFLGRVSQENLPRLYAAADVFVLPSVSRLEAFGIAALEAMASGRPVVVTDIPGVREVIEDGREGLLADPVNPQDLAEKIRTLLADPGLREEMGRRAREKVLSTFTIERVTEQIEAVYRSLLPTTVTSRP